MYLRAKLFDMFHRLETKNEYTFVTTSSNLLIVLKLTGMIDVDYYYTNHY